MLPAFAALLALSSLAVPSASPEKKLNSAPSQHAATRQRYAEGGWKLTIRRDNFTGITSCRLTGKNMRYQRGALGFATGIHADLAGAWYRIDAAAPARWQDLYPGLVAAGVSMETGGIDDPHGGIVWLPIELAGHAREVAIHMGRKTRHYQVGGFAALREAAPHLGCRDDGFKL